MHKYNEPNKMVQDQLTLVKDGRYIPHSVMQGLICDNSSELYRATLLHFQKKMLNSAH